MKMKLKLKKIGKFTIYLWTLSGDDDCNFTMMKTERKKNVIWTNLYQNLYWYVEPLYALQKYSASCDIVSTYILQNMGYKQNYWSFL